MHRLIFILIVMLCMFFYEDMNAQDIHQSQFYTAPLNYNPASTGLFKGDQRISLNYRRQWFIEDIVRYLTLSGSFDMKFYPKKWTTKGMWNLGVQFNYDQAGDSKLGLTNLVLNLAYSYPLNKKNILSAGIAGGYSHRRFKPDELSWDAQWNGDLFDPTLPTEENFAKTSNNFIDAHAGLNYRWQNSERTKMDFGFSAFHLNQPDQRFFDQSLNIKLPIRWNLSFQPNFRITEAFDLMFYGLYQQQQKYNELLLGTYLKVYLNQQRGKELSVLLGIGSRVDDSWIPKIAVQYKNIYAGMSYDITNSGFKNAVNNRGGPEFSFVYIRTKARPYQLLKSCPIF